MQVGQAGIILLLIYSARPLTPQEAAIQAALLLLGAVFQTLLSVAGWPVQRLGPERDAVAAVFQELVSYARNPTSQDAALPASADMTTARQTLAARSRDTSPASEGLRVLLDEAERIRLQLVALDGLRARAAEANDDPYLPGKIDQVREAAGEALAGLADSLRLNRVALGVDESLARIEQAGHDIGQVDTRDQRAESGRSRSIYRGPGPFRSPGRAIAGGHWNWSRRAALAMRRPFGPRRLCLQASACAMFSPFSRLILHCVPLHFAMPSGSPWLWS